MSTWLAREYMSDDVDIEPNRLRLDQGGNGDWYLTILKPGERMGVAVRITTSGTRSSAPDMPRAVFDLYRAMGGERLGEEHDRLAEAAQDLIGTIDDNFYGDMPVALRKLAEAWRSTLDNPRVLMVQALSDEVTP